MKKEKLVGILIASSEPSEEHSEWWSSQQDRFAISDESSKNG